MKTYKMIAMVLMLMVGGGAKAEEKLGVPVYAGAKFEPVATEWAIAMASGDAYCYSTADGLEKVVEFYKAQGLKFVSGDKEKAQFTKGKVEVYLNNPWVDTKAQVLNRTTLISILKPEH